MTITLILHVQNQDPVMGEVEEMPCPGDSLVILKNPRRIDGKDLHYLAENVTTVLWPVIHLNFIEVVTSEEDDQIMGFFRE